MKPGDYKVCVLGLWAAQEAEGRRLVELVEALESGRWVGKASPPPLLGFVAFSRSPPPAAVCSPPQTGLPGHRRLGPRAHGCSSGGGLRAGALQGQPRDGSVILCFYL